MMLAWLIGIPLLGGVLAWWSGRRQQDLPRWIALSVLLLELGLAVTWLPLISAIDITSDHPWAATFDKSWIPPFAIRFQLGLDGLALALILLTIFLGLMAILASWNEVRERVGFFHAHLLWTLAGAIGVFLALDLFLFFLFWELMLIPMYFLIALWGHEQRTAASLKFIIFTQAGGLFMLLSILMLALIHHQYTGRYSFDYFALLELHLNPTTAWWLMLGFLLAFAVKLPMVPLHTWLPDAHTQAPTAGSVILAGVLLKTGAYGLLRFAIPLFPEAALEFAPLIRILAVIGIFYGAILAFAQTDLKRLVAYTSISHLGFVLLGIFTWNELAQQGAVVQMLAHGISTGALFILAGILQERLATRDLGQMGGCWSQAPRLGALLLLFALAALGLPGLGNFVGEFLILLGAYRVDGGLTAVAALGLVTATVYALRLVQKVAFGPTRQTLVDLNSRETFILAVMVVTIVGLGLYPQPVLDTADAALGGLRQSTALLFMEMPE